MILWPLWDRSLLFAINGRNIQPVTWFMRILTNVDNWIPFLAAVIALLLWAGRTLPRNTTGGRWKQAFMRMNPRIVLLCLILATAASDQVCYHLKHSVERPRPCFDENVSSQVVYLGDVHGNRSFPSAHAANSAALAITASLAYPPLAPFALLLSFLVGMSRIYLGVHYPLDVLAGWGIGASTALIVWLLFRKMARRPGLIGFVNRFRCRQPQSGYEPQPPWTPVELRSLDGFRMTGYLLEGGHRLAVLVHGLHEGIESMVEPGRMFAELGFSVLLVPLRGHDGHPVSVTSGGPMEALDLAGALTWAREEKGYARRDTVVYGSSMGGAVSMKTAGLLGEGVYGVVVHGAYEDFFASARARIGGFRTWLMKLILPSGVVRGLKEFVPSEYVSRWHDTGFVYITGTKDRIASPGDVRLTAEKTGGSIILLKDAGHPSWIRRKFSREQMMKAFRESLKLMESSSSGFLCIDRDGNTVSERSLDESGELEDYRPSSDTATESEK